MASTTSATPKMRASRRILSPFKLLGYPEPFNFS